MTMLRLTRLSDAPPPARDLLEVADDGTLDGWRSQGPVVGRCGGSAPDVEGLKGQVAAAVAGSVPEAGGFPLDATVETLTVGDRELATAVHATVDGPWGTLLAAARGLLDDVLPGAPSAAVALELREAEGIRLVHRGDAPLTLELGAGWAEVTRWRDGAPVGDAETRDLGMQRIEAGPGWSADVPIAVPAGEPGDLLTASAWFVADDAGVHVPVVLTGRATAT